MMATANLLWPWIAVIRDFLAGERLGLFWKKNPDAMAGQGTWIIENGRILLSYPVTEPVTANTDIRESYYAEAWEDT